MKSSILVEKMENTIGVRLVGTINEDTPFSKTILPADSLIEIDLKAVTGINSCGVREWMVWIASTPADKLSFLNCPKVIVDQMNMVQGFLPNGAKICSLLVPYFNETTGEDKIVLFSYGKEYDENGLNSTPEVFDSKGEPMEMDVVESKYFNILKK